MKEERRRPEEKKEVTLVGITAILLKQNGTKHQRQHLEYDNLIARQRCRHLSKTKIKTFEMMLILRGQDFNVDLLGN